MVKMNLANLTIMVTRPKPQGEELCHLIDQYGGRSIYFPTLEIHPVKNIDVVKNQIEQLDQFDWLIFISANAVTHSASLIHSIWPVLPEKIKIAAIGESTAKLLKASNLPVHAIPELDWSSEGLLNLPAFQSIKNKKIALICGENGRDLLNHELRSRGALLTEIIVYRRSQPVIDVSSYTKMISTHQIHIIVTTSGESIQNLKDLLTYCWEDLAKIPVIVVSERLKSLAGQLGFKSIFLAKNASHHAIIETIARNKEQLCQTDQHHK